MGDAQICKTQALLSGRDLLDDLEVVRGRVLLEERVQHHLVAERTARDPQRLPRAAQAGAPVHRAAEEERTRAQVVVTVGGENRDRSRREVSQPNRPTRARIRRMRAMTMKLYYATATCSHAVHIALREADLPFSLLRYDMKGARLEDGRPLEEVNAKGFVPVLELSDG